MNGVYKVGDTVFENWQLGKLIGRGSFGSVYEIERDNFGRKEKAALKIITIPQNDSDIDDLISDGYDEKSITSRFESYLHDIVQEYSVMADLKGCVNIVYSENVRYVQHDNGIGWDIFIRMELLTPLTKAISNSVAEEQVIKIGSDLCNALVFCGKHNVLHRDIKPQNIFVSADGTYKLGDFGIAKVSDHTTLGTKTGTFKYMAPEVYHLQPYGPGADLYSLGLVLYWLLNDRRTPFLPLPPVVPSSADEEAAKEKRYSGISVPPPAHGSEELKEIVLKACAFDPKDRYQSAEEMQKDLQSIGKSPSPPPPPVPPVPPPAPPELKEICPNCRAQVSAGSIFCPACGASMKKTSPRKKLWLIIGGAALVLVLLVALIYLFRSNPDPAPTPVYSTSDTSAASTTSSTYSAASSSATLHTHTWSEWKVETVPCCETAGIEVRTCLDDPSHRESREIPALGHDWANATITAPKTCRRCGKQTGLYEYISKKCSESNYNIELPEESEILDQTELRYVKGTNTSSSGGIYLMTKEKGRNIIFLKNHTQLSVYAYRGRFALVVTDSGRVGWVWAERISESNDFS